MQLFQGFDAHRFMVPDVFNALGQFFGSFWSVADPDHSDHRTLCINHQAQSSETSKKRWSFGSIGLKVDAPQFEQAFGMEGRVSF